METQKLLSDEGFNQGGRSSSFGGTDESLLFRWMTQQVFNGVSSYKDHEILGLSTRIWVEVLILVLIAYDLINLIIHILIYFIRLIFDPKSKTAEDVNFKQYLLFVRSVVYYARGLTLSISFLLNSLMFFLIWIYFFGSQLDLKSSNVRQIWEYGKWTFLCLLIYSVLKFIKTTVLLVWEAQNIYDRFQRQVISKSKKLYFLGLLDRHTHIHDILGLRQNVDDIQEKASEDRSISEVSWCIRFGFAIFNLLMKKNGDLEERGKVEEKKKRVRCMLQIGRKQTESSMDDVQPAISVNGVQRVASYFIMAKNGLLEEKFKADILSHFKEGTDIRTKLKDLILLDEITNDGTQNPRGSDSVEDAQQQHDVAESSSRNSRSDEVDEAKIIQVEQQDVANSSDDKDWIVFLNALEVTNQKKMNSDSEILLSDIQTWLERAHNQCVNLANMLSNAKDLAESLNKVISWILIVAISIMWLLLTGLATTKVFVLIASPLLAATFIFGDTCKTLFQGFIFVYVVRPFDVGDLCVIDDKEMEVRSIGIWTTTFTNLDKFGMAQESVVYFNSEFTNKIIINHKTKFNWSDREVFKLSKVNITNNEEEKDLINFFMKRLKPGSEEYSLTVDEETRKYCFLSRSPDISVKPGEKGVTLAIRLEYDSQSAADWTYSQCFRHKDRLRGQFRLYIEHIISKYEGLKGANTGQGQQASSLEEDW